MVQGALQGFSAVGREALKFGWVVFSVAAQRLLPLWRQRNTKYRQGRNRPAMFGGVPSAGRWLLGGKAGASAPLHLVSEFAHGFLRDDVSLATCK